MVDFLKIEASDDHVWSQKILKVIAIFVRKIYRFGHEMSVRDFEIEGQLNKVNSTR